MVHTLPDYTTSYKLVQVFGNIENNELAARLGSPNFWDRRGLTYYQDDFERTPLNWGTTLSGGRGSITIDDTRSFTGSKSMKLTTGDQNGDYVIAEKRFHIPSSTRIGMEFHTWTIANDMELTAFLIGYDGTNQYTAKIEYYWQTGRFSYQDAAGVDQDLPGGIPKIDANEPWTGIKLVVDWNTREWVRVIGGPTTHDLSGVAMRSVADATVKQMWIWLIASTDAAAAKTLYIDNFILTQYEQ